MAYKCLTLYLKDEGREAIVLYAVYILHLYNLWHCHAYMSFNTIYIKELVDSLCRDDKLSSLNRCQLKSVASTVYVHCVS